MKPILSQLSIFLAVAFLTVGCATPHTEATIWEYKVITGAVVTGLQANIDKLAADGWRVISVSTEPGYGAFAVMGRPKK